jgi:hypothetical protein
MASASMAAICFSGPSPLGREDADRDEHRLKRPFERAHDPRDRGRVGHVEPVGGRDRVVTSPPRAVISAAIGAADAARSPDYQCIDHGAAT